jgi:glycosyltransferase involved in cell wall biosynthesis
MVSVVIPVYNGEKYICESVDSVLSQTYDNVEIIVVDDGSTDKTRNFLEKYIAKEQIIYIYQDNGGRSKARNTGIKNANGEYIAFLDADDVFLPASIEKKIDAATRYPGRDLIFADHQVRRSCGENPDPPYHKHRGTFIKMSKDLFLRKGNIIILKDCWYHYLLQEGEEPHISSCLMKRSVFDDIGYFDEDLTRAEDTDLMLRCIMAKRTLFIDRSLSIYNKCRSSLLSTGSADLEYCGIIKYLKKMNENKGVKNNRQLKRLFRIKLSRGYYALGRFYLKNKVYQDKKQSVLCFIKSIKYNPFFFKTYLSLFLAFIKI